MRTFIVKANGRGAVRKMGLVWRLGGKIRISFA